MAETMTREDARRPTVRHQIDWVRHRAVVFESDDWGACEVAATPADAAIVADVWEELHGRRREVHATLETPGDLALLYDLLAAHPGADGLPAVFTAFVSVANPDFPAIRASGFERYADLAADEAVPHRWQRGDLVGAWREGIRRGVFAPEYHANLHHTSPVRWLERLRSSGPVGEAARRLFDLEVYCQGEHLPEFEGLSLDEEFAWHETGMARFERICGYRPAAAITSDAYPETETLWALLGVRTICLKSCRVNSGQVVVYPTKPWNNQDPAVPIGACHPRLDVAYLTRNVFLESAGRPEQSARVAAEVIRARWAEGEPAVISTHRANYVSLDPALAEDGRRELERLLAALATAGARFLTSAEVGDLYRRGWSLRAVGARHVLRVWSEDAGEVRLPGRWRAARELPHGVEHAGHADADATVFVLGVGEYTVS